MQIWRTTRSPPGTSCMKARLVWPLCFAFAMLPQKSLASSSIWSVSFRPGCEFCVSECHQKGVKSSTEEKVFSFSLPVHLWEEKRRRKGVHDRRGNWKSLFAIFQAGRSKQICNRSHLATSRWHLLSLVSTNRAVEVHSLGDSTVIFVLCNSVRVDADVNDFFFWERGCISRWAFLYVGKGTCGTPLDTT